jgi:hypothetical protein
MATKMTGGRQRISRVLWGGGGNNRVYKEARKQQGARKARRVMYKRRYHYGGFSDLRSPRLVSKIWKAPDQDLSMCKVKVFFSCFFEAINHKIGSFEIWKVQYRLYWVFGISKDPTKQR